MFVYCTRNLFAVTTADVYISLKETRVRGALATSTPQSDALAAGSLQLQLSADGKRSAKVAYICSVACFYSLYISIQMRYKKQSENQPLKSQRSLQKKDIQLNSHGVVAYTILEYHLNCNSKLGRLMI